VSTKVPFIGMSGCPDVGRRARRDQLSWRLTNLFQRCAPLESQARWHSDLNAGQGEDLGVHDVVAEGVVDLLAEISATT